MGKNAEKQYVQREFDTGMLGFRCPSKLSTDVHGRRMRMEGRRQIHKERNMISLCECILELKGINSLMDLNVILMKTFLIQIFTNIQANKI